MPIRHMIIHQIDKKPDGTPAILRISDREMVECQANEDLLHELNTTYNAKPGKGWRFFHAESGAHPFSGWLKQYVGRRVNEYFRDFIGCQEGIDSPGETRTLLKAFSDFVESEDLGEEAAREKTDTLVSYAMAQAKIGEPVTLDELSELLDEDQPKNFAEFIQGKDYGLSASLPPDKKTLNKFRRFTGRADGLSISFEQHLLGSKVEFDEADGTLTLRGLPTQLPDQLKRAAA